MKTPIAIVMAVAAAGLGFVAGRAADATSSTPIAGGEVDRGLPVAPVANDRADRARSDDDPLAQRDRRRARGEIGDEPALSPSDPTELPKTQDSATTGPTSSDGDDPDDGSGVADHARRQRELVGAGETCLELLGKPVETPKDISERFSGASVSGAVRQAIQQTGVTGDVEGVDCSEFPCIVFGRLAGDEEDIEEIERSPALDRYEGDVLTLLLWATTVDQHAKTHPTAKETGLFALAYYDFDDRADAGAELDRRIRARVLEVWNEDRPGPAG